MKTYYFPDNAYVDNFFGSNEPCCIDLAEVERLAHEWDMTVDELLNQLHEATESEMDAWGVYDG